MSRAINLQMTEANVHEKCREFDIAISAIEPLPSGGTHLVCTTPEGADRIRVLFKQEIIAGVVKRFPFYRVRGPL